MMGFVRDGVFRNGVFCDGIFFVMGYLHDRIFS